MAKSALRIRFVINAQGGANKMNTGSRQRFAYNFAQQIVENVAFKYSDETYLDLASRFEAQFVADARKELVHLAALFRQHITGSSPTDTPTGTLTLASYQTSAKGTKLTQGMPIKQSVPKWAPRSKAYVRYKRRKLQHANWWEAKGISPGRANQYTGLKANTKADTWIKMFGPIRAVFTRSTSATALAATPGTTAPKSFNMGSGHVKVAVGTLKVYALTKLTPAMIPALATGDPGTLNPGTGKGNPGLMKLVRAVDDDMYNRLDGRSRRQFGSVYRPTLEPFLAYFLTRAVPNAIANRLKEGQLNVRRRRTFNG